MRSRSGKRDSAFGAPWGRSLKVITFSSLLLLGAMVALPFALPSRHAAGPAFLPIAGLGLLLGATALFAVRGYAVRGRRLLIRRSFWWTEFSLRGLKAARSDPRAMSRAWRTLGNGGLFAFAGWFSNRRLGRFRAYVTDPRRAVVLEWADRKLVVSPDAPDAFVSALGLAEEGQG